MVSVKRESVSLTLPDGRTLDVQISRNARTRISLNLSPRGEARLSIPPQADDKVALDFLHQRRDWLMLHLAQQPESQPEPAAQPALPDSILYQGQPMTLTVTPGRQPKVGIMGDTLQVSGVTPQRPAQAIIAHWLTMQAALALPVRASMLAGQYGVRPAKIDVSNAGRRWGSCTARGNIRLNWRLVQAPGAVMDYVITHELAHLRHMNHSAAFWAQVEQWCPDWKQHRNWLKKHGDQLFALG